MRSLSRVLLILLLGQAAFGSIPCHDYSWTNQWWAAIGLTPGPHQLWVSAAHPSGMFVTNRSVWFTNNVGNRVSADSFDANGRLSERDVKDASGATILTQSFNWDQKGRLVQVVQMDNNGGGYSWGVLYDPFGRPWETAWAESTNLASTAQVHYIAHFYDPQTEFLELGVSFDYPDAIWKIYGPDLDGRYGGLDGVGGLDAVVTPTGEMQSAIADSRGNIQGYYDPGAGSNKWVAARVSGYGAVPGYRPIPLGSSASFLESCAWRGKAPEITGYYWLGARYYNPESGNFLSSDPIWNGRDPNYYTFCGGDPENYFDADGRLGKRALNALDDANGDIGGVVERGAGLVGAGLNYMAENRVGMGSGSGGGNEPSAAALPLLMMLATDGESSLLRMAATERTAALDIATAGGTAARSAATLGETTYDVSFGSTGSGLLDSLGLQGAKISNIAVKIDPTLTGADLLNTSAHESFHVAVAQNFPNFAASSGRLPFIGAFPLYAEEVGAYGFGAASAGRYGQALLAPASAFQSLTVGQSISVLGTGTAVGGLWYYNTH